jgi:signal transduction histidine kinase/HPt (histidine-containing phosphotransfer) domain-containing protein
MKNVNRRTETSETKRPAAQPRPFAGVSILIAEDSPTQAELLRHTLERQGFDVTAAMNGREALEMARAKKPKLIISDIMMPEMDGYELCRQVKADEKLKGVPVILLTTLADPHDVIRGLECRADNFIIKPFDEKNLVNRVQFMLINSEIREGNPASIGVEVYFNGQKHFITADRLNILNLLLSTYETAVHRNQELSRARDDLHAANRAKGDFLANMSHEIRTPMTAILGYADMLLDAATSPAEREDHVRVIRHHGEHLLTILNDILDFSKIEAGKLSVEIIDVDPRQIVGDVLSLMRVRAAEKKLKLSVTYATAIPRVIHSDPTRLRQILINLVGNAIKFTADGMVNVVLGLVNDPDSKPMLEVSVVDTGIGMKAQQIKGLFTPFQQADSSTTRRFGGTGLGLTICKRLASMLGGDISVRSQAGQGSCFTVTIDPGDLTGVPLLEGEYEAIRPQEASEPHPPMQLQGRLLLAEDGVHNQRAITFYLNKAGAQVELAGNGRVACDMAMEALAAGKPYDVILMDMQMPEMDGYAAATWLRQRKYTGPIIALTAHAMSHDRERCIKAGCTDYLSKPIDRRQLILTVASYLTPNAAAAEVETPRPPGVLHSTEKGDEEFISQFLPAFVADLPTKVSQIAALADQRNLEELERVVHQLKGSAGMYGFRPLSDAAARVESVATEAESVQLLADEVKSLIDLIRQVEGYEPAKESPRESNK